MLSRLKKFIPNSTKKTLLEFLAIYNWAKRGCTMPLPPSFKKMIIKKIALRSQAKIFVETGTYLGDTTMYMKDYFDKIYSIELDHKLYINAKDKFSKYENIEIIQGDSANVLEALLMKINSPTLFWLDGHYSAGITAKGSLNTPILRELDLILNHKIKNHTILIDDARCFNGQEDYPTLETVETLIKEKNPKLNFKVENDMIIIQ